MTGKQTNFRILLVTLSIQRNAHSSVILSVVEESNLIKNQYKIRVRLKSKRSVDFTTGRLGGNSTDRLAITFY